MPLFGRGFVNFSIEEAQELHPDLILLDLSTPVMNGLDAARALTRLMPEVQSSCTAHSAILSPRENPVQQAYRR